MLKVNVNIVPTEGASRMQTVEVSPTGASIQQICDAGGIDTRNKDFAVNGRPAALDTHVGASDTLEAKDRGRAAVAVSERPQGS